jgi:hypothetical protein
MYDMFEMGEAAEKVESRLTENYFTLANPGPMRTKEELTESDKDFENLYGTSGDMGAGYEPDYLDAYIDPKYTTQTQTYFIYG